MLLGLSGLEAGEDVGLGPVAGSENGDGGIEAGAALSRFAEAVHRDDDVASARTAVIDAVGPEGLVDAAAICANFNMMVRIADGTGTPLDKGSVDISADLRDELDLDGLTSRRHVDEQPLEQR